MSGLPQHQLHITFSAGSERATSELARAGWTAFEQAEVELERTGVQIELQPDVPDDNNSTRGITGDAILVNVTADVITMLLFRAVSELVLFVRRNMSKSHYPTQAISQAPGVVLAAENKVLYVNADMPEDETLKQLELWAPAALNGGNITIRLADEQP